MSAGTLAADVPDVADRPGRQGARRRTGKYTGGNPLVYGWRSSSSP